MFVFVLCGRCGGGGILIFRSHEGKARGLADQFADVEDYAELHFAARKRILDREEPDYAD